MKPGLILAALMVTMTGAAHAQVSPVPPIIAGTLNLGTGTTVQAGKLTLGSVGQLTVDTSGNLTTSGSLTVSGGAAFSPSSALIVPPISFNSSLTLNQPASLIAGGTRTWSGGETAVTNAEVSSFTNQTGSSTAGPVAYHFFRVASDTVQAAAAGGATNLESDLYTGTGITGPRESIGASISVNGTPGDGAQYSTGVFQFQATAPAYSTGNIGYGANPTCGLLSGATGNWQCVGEEIDVAAATGTTPTMITGLAIVPASNHAVSGSNGLDSGLVFGSLGAAAGWNYGIRFGGPSESFPFNSGATLIYSYPAASGLTIANGIDLHNNTFTGNAYNDGHFAMTGGGQFVQAKITDPNTAPGAGKMQFTVEAGTTAGTCKIVARAGTSATPVTIVDNVGTGC